MPLVSFFSFFFVVEMALSSPGPCLSTPQSIYTVCETGFSSWCNNMWTTTIIGQAGATTCGRPVSSANPNSYSFILCQGTKLVNKMLSSATPRSGIPKRVATMKSETHTHVPNSSRVLGWWHAIGKESNISVTQVGKTMQ